MKQPQLFDISGVEQQPEPECAIDFDSYGRQVNIFLSGKQHREFKQKVDQLAEYYGTKNATETVLKALDVALELRANAIEF